MTLRITAYKPPKTEPAQQASRKPGFKDLEKRLFESSILPFFKIADLNQLNGVCRSLKGVLFQAIHATEAEVKKFTEFMNQKFREGKDPSPISKIEFQSFDFYLKFPKVSNWTLSNLHFVTFLPLNCSNLIYVGKEFDCATIQNFIVQRPNLKNLTVSHVDFDSQAQKSYIVFCNFLETFADRLSFSVYISKTVNFSWDNQTESLSVAFYNIDPLLFLFNKHIKRIKLSFEDNSNYDNKNLLTYLPLGQLESFHYDGPITSEIVDQIIRNAPHLKSLSISRTELLTDHTILTRYRDKIREWNVRIYAQHVPNTCFDWVSFRENNFLEIRGALIEEWNPTLSFYWNKVKILVTSHNLNTDLYRRCHNLKLFRHMYITQDQMPSILSSLSPSLEKFSIELWDMEEKVCIYWDHNMKILTLTSIPKFSDEMVQALHPYVERAKEIITEKCGKISFSK